MLSGYNYDFHHDEDKPKRINYIKTKDIFKTDNLKIQKDLKKIDDEKKKEVREKEKEGKNVKDLFSYKKHEKGEKIEKKELKKEDNKKEDLNESLIHRNIKMKQKQGYF